jgi:hypothetical protein
MRRSRRTGGLAPGIAPLLALGLGAGLAVAACSGGDSTGPPVVLSLSVTELPAMTSQSNVTVTGSTDGGAQVDITGGASFAGGPAGAGGGFSIQVPLLRNQTNTLSVKATSARGDTSRTVVVSTLHYDLPPTLAYTSPLSGQTTTGQAGFVVRVTFSDAGAGIDPESFSVASSDAVGGAYLRSGRTSALLPANTNLAGVFQVSGTSADWIVPDSMAFAPGTTQLSARVSDRAGNSAVVPISFTVAPDPDALIAADAAGLRGQPTFLEVGLRNFEPVAGVQFDLALQTAAIASVDSAFVVGRGSVLNDGALSIIGGNTVRVVLLDAQGGVIPGGQGAILRLFVTVRATASTGVYGLGMSGAVLSNTTGQSRNVAGFSANLVVQ